ncbi:MAG: hypothetical protein JJU33_14030 [Phycisphaerales bacterium]|nr:hypothetical protein [Phycisphaerales bacterium]
MPFYLAQQAGQSSEFVGQTTLHPLGVAAMLVCGVALLLLPRRHAVLPMLVICCFVAMSQRIVIAGADFNLLRIMVLFGAARVLLRQEYLGVRFNRVDALLCAWLVAGAAIYIIREGTPDAVVNRSGWIFDGAGMYFLFRCLIREWRDIVGVGFALAIIVIPVLCVFLVEKSTGRNLFSIFGGIPEHTGVRDGKLRARGAFAHAILAGTFWAVAMPFIALQWWTNPRRRPLVFAGIVCSLGIIVMCASSGPVASAGVAFAIAGLYPLRKYSRLMLAAGVVMLVGLHFAMNAPVWHLIGRIDFVGGSTGYHRYQLIDSFMSHPDKWIWLGATDIAFLADFHGAGVADITNQYILEAVRGGLVTLIVYLLMIGAALQLLLRAVDTYSGDRVKSVIVWAVLISLGVHLVSFISVSYFGQIIMLWFLTLAMAGSIGEWAARPRAVRAMRPVCAARTADLLKPSRAETSPS